MKSFLFSDKSVNVGAIVGGIIGSVVAVVIGVVVIRYIRKVSGSRIYPTETPNKMFSQFCLFR